MKSRFEFVLKPATHLLKRLGIYYLASFLLLESYLRKGFIQLIKFREHRKDDSDNIALEPLYPDVRRDDEHKIYIKVLNKALKDKDIHNIALTGGYGSGKSSILKGFTEDKLARTIYISFSTLGADLAKQLVNTPAKEDGQKSEEEPKPTSIASLMQKEIVKHILYRERPSQLPASRFLRIAKIKVGRVISWTLALTALLPAILYVTNLYSIQRADVFKSAVFMAVFFIVTYIVVKALLPFLRRLQPDKIKSGPVTIGLSNSTNYFDQYLDEIIYFFEATKCEIVILEDLDRFKDLYIFESLRQLNIILNNSKQIKKKSIKFIYAVKDSAFVEEVVNAGEQPEPGNRTKFFDLIIPTVPFITYKNSRDIMISTFAPYGVNKRVIILIAEYLTDMRLIKNIHNEFIIFYKKIFEEGKISDLSPSNLFALIVYKNIEVKDFEKIRVGAGKLKDVYDRSRSFVDEQFDEISESIARARRQVGMINSVGSRSDGLGSILTVHISEMLEAESAYLVSVVFKGKNYTTLSQLRQEEFWLDMCSAEGSDELDITYSVKPPSAGYFNGAQSIKSYSVDDIRQIVSNDLDSKDWNSADAAPLKEKIAMLDHELKTLRTKNIKQLLIDYEAFREDVVGITGKGLAMALLSSGYIDANYILYTSIYREESVSAKGMIYIVNHLHKGNRDVYYDFEGDENIKNVLDDLDPVYFQTRNIYNFDIINYLLKNDDPRIESILDNLAEDTDDDRAFIDKFFEGENNISRLTEKLASRWRRIFTYIVDSEVLDDYAKDRLLHLSIVNSGETVDYEVSNEARAYLARRAGTIACLAGDLDDRTTLKAQRVLTVLDVRLVALREIKNTKLKNFVEENGFYALNLENITELIGERNIALDNIEKRKPKVFAYVIDNLEIYASMLNESKKSQYSIENGRAFIPIMNQIAESNERITSTIIERSSQNCLVEDIEETSRTLWRPLISNVRVTNTVHNILNYFNVCERQIDGPLENYLSASNHFVGECSEEEHAMMRQELATEILNNSELKVESKLSLVSDLKLSQPLDVNLLKRLEPKLYDQLLGRGLVEDTSETFEKLSDRGWQLRESHIASSMNLLEYIGIVEFKSEELAAIPLSDRIPEAVKMYVLLNAHKYGASMSGAGKSNLARYAIAEAVALNADPLIQILDGTVYPENLKLTIQSLDKLSPTDILHILPRLGGEYLNLSIEGKRPRLANSELNLQLLEHLVLIGVVNSYESSGDFLKANNKGKFLF